MALVRILIDGYNLIHAWQRHRQTRDNQARSPRHNWPELAPGQARHSAAARDALIRRLTLYQDAIGTPITVFFDGSGRTSGKPAASSKSEIEVLYSREGQTADQMIERAVHRFEPYGAVLAVTDDHAERETVNSLGGSAASCSNFIRDVEDALAELGDDIKHHNRRERHTFQQRK